MLISKELFMSPPPHLDQWIKYLDEKIPRPNPDWYDLSTTRGLMDLQRAMGQRDVVEILKTVATQIKGNPA